MLGWARKLVKDRDLNIKHVLSLCGGIHKPVNLAALTHHSFPDTAHLTKALHLRVNNKLDFRFVATTKNNAYNQAV